MPKNEYQLGLTEHQPSPKIPYFCCCIVSKIIDIHDTTPFFKISSNTFTTSFKEPTFDIEIQNSSG